MTLEQSSVFIVGSILVMLGLVIISIGAVTINNIFHRYWKPVTLFSKDSFTLFGNTTSATDPMTTLTQEEYDKLVEHLEHLRSKKETIDKSD